MEEPVNPKVVREAMINTIGEHVGERIHLFLTIKINTESEKEWKLGIG
jgi:hypothetical protein